MDLKNKVAIVTGASDGIGKETALRLAKEGVRLALIARRQEALDLVSKECISLGSPDARGYSCDITDNKQIEKAINQVIVDFNEEVDILINIAGVWQKLNYIEDIPAEEIEMVIRTNMISVIQITRLVMPYLKQQEKAAIINFASRSGVSAQPGQTIYCASKWGVRGFTEVLKEDLKDTKVRVAALYPAGIKTKILEKAGDKISTDEYSDPADIANVIAFMLSQPDNLWLHEVRITY